MATTVNIKGLDKARLLAALVNGGQPLGLGIRQYRHMSVEEARTWIEERRAHDTAALPTNGRLYFDYVHGVPVKSDLTEDEVDPRLYDRDQGVGAFQRVVDDLRAQPEGSTEGSMGLGSST